MGLDTVPYYHPEAGFPHPSACYLQKRWCFLLPQTFWSCLYRTLTEKPSPHTYTDTLMWLKGAVIQTYEQCCFHLQAPVCITYSGMRKGLRTGCEPPKREEALMLSQLGKQSFDFHWDGEERRMSHWLSWCLKDDIQGRGGEWESEKAEESWKITKIYQRRPTKIVIVGFTVLRLCCFSICQLPGCASLLH